MSVFQAVSKMSAFIVALCFLGFGSEGLAESPEYQEKFYTIGSVVVNEVPDDDSIATDLVVEHFLPEQLRSQLSRGNTSSARWSGMIDGSFPPSFPIPRVSDPTDIIGLGRSVWEVIVENKPTSNVKTDKVDALPNGTTSWLDLQGWQAPRSQRFKVTYSNLVGINVVSFAYRVIYTYGGNIDGVGHYLANVTVVPAELLVMWGFKFDMSVSVSGISNVGTSADPVAGAELLVHWSVDSVLNHMEQSSSFFIRGDGYLTKI